MEFKQVISSNEAVKAIKKVRKYVSKSKQIKHVTRWKKSGMNQSEFCKHHKLNLKTFSGWLRNTLEANGAAPLASIKNAVNDPPKSEVSLQCQFPNGSDLTINGMIDKSLLTLIIQEVALCKFN